MKKFGRRQQTAPRPKLVICPVCNKRERIALPASNGYIKCPTCRQWICNEADCYMPDLCSNCADELPTTDENPPTDEE